MAKKTKAQLLKEAKELGLNPNPKWTVYELEHRIADKQREIEDEKAKQAGKATAKSPSTSPKRRSGEY